jgi:hypothetical protein
MTRSIPVVVLSLFSLLAVKEAKAQNYCFPQAASIPGMTGAPTNISDPRWHSAFAAVPTGGMPGPGGTFPPAYTADPYEFRALTVTESGQKYLVLTWRTDADPGAQVAGDPDVLYAYFVQGEGTVASPYTGNRIIINRLATKCSKGCSIRCGALAASIGRYDAATSSWMSIASEGYGNPLPDANMPAWLLDNTILDQECTTVGTNLECGAWTVTMKIPLSPSATPENPSTGLNLPTTGTFKFAQDMFVYSNTAPDTWTTKYFSWPDTTTPSNPEASMPRPISSFGTVQLGGAGCATGVWIDSSRIAVNGGNEINILSPNTFTATPVNGLAVSVADQGVAATFRIADWGAAYVGDTPSWRDVPGCTKKTATTGGAVAAGGSFNIQCNWSVPADEQCLYQATCPTGCPAGTPASSCRNTHQCVMVELHANNAATLPAGFYFSRQSAYRNMDFINASDFIASARLSVLPEAKAVPLVVVPSATAKPLPKPVLEPKARDMYIYIRTTGMPTTMPKPLPKQLPKAEVLKTFKDAKLVATLDKLGVREGKIDKAVASTLKEQMKLGTISHRDVAAVLPTYTAYVWQDTGRKTKLKGKEVKVLRAAPSFGYYVSHEGELVGWKYGLAGNGISKIGPNLYKVSVPSKGGLSVRPWLSACEDAACMKKADPK